MIHALALLAAAAGADAAADADQAAQRADDIIVTGARTEGLDAYGVKEQRTALRIPLSQKDTPQSVSVITRAQIEDFQLNSVNDLLATVPGVSVLAAETDRVYYSARGFDIQTFQIDGIGLPFSFGIQTGSLDTAIYDRIEVVRGAPGLLSPTGNPSAVVNFVRKRPYRDFKATVSAQYGSFDNLRLDGDVSVPITSDGSIRARAVGAYLDTGSHLDRYHLTRWTGYGIVEADLGPNTVVSAGYATQDHDSDAAMWGAIPLYYSDGTPLKFDRSANYAPKWSGWGVVDRQIFGDITHDFGNGWTAKLSVLRKAIGENDALLYVYGNPSRTAADGIDLSDPANPQSIFSYPGAFRGKTRNLTIDAYASGKLSVAGRDHEIMFGVQRGAESYQQYSSYDYSQVGVPIPLTTFFDGTFPRTNFPTPYDLSLDQHTRRETVYGLLRLNLADPLKLMLGGNYTHATSKGVSYGDPQDYDRKKFLPFVGATFAVTPSISAYASYSSIFNPQVQFDQNNRLLDPIEGNNLEAGIKGEWMDGRLYASAAIFRAKQNNTATQTGFDEVLGRTIYEGVDAKSEGVELEFGGELLPGLQATGGVTALRVKNEDGDPERTFVPRRTARLNLVYSPPALPALKLGSSIQYQSSIYYDTTSGVRLRQGAYALVDLLAAYSITDNLKLGVNLKNVTNSKYLSSLTFEQSYYGAGRSVLGTVTLRY